MVIGGGFRQRAEFLISDCFVDNLEKIKSSASTTGGNFDEFKIGRAA
jgi:hypothetical protein